MFATNFQPKLSTRRFDFVDSLRLFSSRSYHLVEKGPHYTAWRSSHLFWPTRQAYIFCLDAPLWLNLVVLPRSLLPSRVERPRISGYSGHMSPPEKLYTKGSAILRINKIIKSTFYNSNPVFFYDLLIELLLSRLLSQPIIL